MLRKVGQIFDEEVSVWKRSCLFLLIIYGIRPSSLLINKIALGATCWCVINISEVFFSAQKNFKEKNAEPKRTLGLKTKRSYSWLFLEEHDTIVSGSYHPPRPCNFLCTAELLSAQLLSKDAKDHSVLGGPAVRAGGRSDSGRPLFFVFRALT